MKVNAAIRWVAALVCACVAGQSSLARAEGVGPLPTRVHFGDARSGKNDGITDVAGVMLNHVTRRSTPAIADGATILYPNADPWRRKVAAATYTINGNGALTNRDWIDESGYLETPILLVGNTLDVGRAYDGVIDAMIVQHPQIGRTDDVPLPVVGEIDGQRLDDVQARTIGAADIVRLARGVHGGAFERGAVGAGTPATAFQYKGGIGSSSRIIDARLGGYTVGVLVNANMDLREHLRIGGVPVGRLLPRTDLPRAANRVSFRERGRAQDGSIIIIVATDAPLDGLRLRELAKRTAAGLYRSGSNSRLSSGDQVIAFSTTRTFSAARPDGDLVASSAAILLADDTVNALFAATADATESAVDNALLAANSLTSNGSTVTRLPRTALIPLLKRSAGARVSGDVIELP